MNIDTRWYCRDIDFIPLESQTDLSQISSTCWLEPSTSSTSFFSGFQTRRSFWRPQRSLCELSQTRPLSNAFFRHTLGEEAGEVSRTLWHPWHPWRKTHEGAHLWWLPLWGGVGSQIWCEVTARTGLLVSCYFSVRCTSGSPKRRSLTTAFPSSGHPLRHQSAGTHTVRQKKAESSWSLITDLISYCHQLDITFWQERCVGWETSTDSNRAKQNSNRKYREVEEKHLITWQDWWSCLRIFCNFPYSSLSRYSFPNCMKETNASFLLLKCIVNPTCSWIDQFSISVYLCVSFEPQSVIFCVFQSF